MRGLLLGGCLLLPAALPAATTVSATAAKAVVVDRALLAPVAAAVPLQAAPAPIPAPAANAGGGPASVADTALAAEPALVPDLNQPAPDAEPLPAGSVVAGVVDAAVKELPKPLPGSKRIDRAFADQVFAEICRQGIREPQIVMRQALLETGWMRAPFLMSRNNLFGFRYRSYLRFDSWQDSVRYYRDWQARRYKASDPSYYAFLQRIRYGAPTYLQHLRKMKWDKSCPPSPLQAPPPEAPELPAAETLAHPTLPSQVEAIVPSALPSVPAADAAASAAVVLPLAPAAAPIR